MKPAIQKHLERDEKYEQEKSEDRKRWEQYLNSNDYINQDSMERTLSNLITQARNKDKAR